MGVKIQRTLLTLGIVVLCASSVSAQWGWGGGDWGNGNFNGNCRPWSDDDCNNDDNNSDGSGSSTDPANFGFSRDDLSRWQRIVTIHAVLASLVWVFLIPAGAILIRLGLKSPWIVRIHAILQSLSYLIYIAAVALGIWLVREVSYGGNSLWSDPHTKLGIGILAVAFVQPILGVAHHVIFKRRAEGAKAGRSTKQPGRTAFGHAHVWIGRILIVLGMVNGGLGLRLAANSPFDDDNQRGKIIGYSVGAAIMFLLYIIFVIRAETKRMSNKRTEPVPLEQTTRGVPLNDVHPPPLYNHPPTYDESQEDVRKPVMTTTRYT